MGRSPWVVLKSTDIAEAVGRSAWVVIRRDREERRDRYGLSVIMDWGDASGVGMGGVRSGGAVLEVKRDGEDAR